MTKKNKILFVHSSNELYGSDRVLLQVIEGLPSERFEPIVVTPTDAGKHGPLGRHLHSLSIRHEVVQLGVLRRRYMTPVGMLIYLTRILVGTYQLLRLISKYKVDLVHTNTSAILSGAFAARLTSKPHVWHVHEIVEHPKWLGTFLNRFILNNSTRIVAISRAVAEKLGHSQKSNEVTVIWNGVDLDRLKPALSQSTTRDSGEGWGNEVVLGLIGRLSHWKGQELFLEAAAEALAQEKNLHFLIVGGAVPGDEGRLPALQALAAKLNIRDKVTFLPFTEEIGSIFHSLDIVVVPSTLPEPFGLVVVEGMAASRPVIAAAHGGPKEIVVDGETGLLFQPSDVSSLRDAILKLARDPSLRLAMGSAGYARAVQCFGLRRFQRSFISLYNSLLAGE